MRLSDAPLIIIRYLLETNSFHDTMSAVRFRNTAHFLLSRDRIKSIATQSRLHLDAVITHEAKPSSKTIEQETDEIRTRLYGDVEPVIGLEVHAQLNLKSKLFSQGGLSSNAPPNSQLDLFDLSYPGTLPKLNQRAIDFAIMTGLALNCNIERRFSFDRKNYFYADMPAGYQITQYDHPIARSGCINFIVTPYHDSLIAHEQQYDIVKYLYANSRLDREEIRPYIKRSHIKQIQLEQDSAKTLQHVINKGSTVETELCNLVDYNRSGAALIEIVFEPDLTNHHEASSLVRELIFTLRALGTCSCELQEGSLRVDANVSIRKIGGSEISGTSKVELKNLNSLRALNRGIHREILRQANILREGGKVAQESRTFDSKTKETVFLRRKETALDYRYMPEPSIPPVNIDQQHIDDLKKSISETELPAKCKEKLINKYNMELSLVNEVVEEPGLTGYIDSILSHNHDLAKAPRYDPNVVADFLIYTIFNLKNLKVTMLPIGEIKLNGEDSEFRKRVSVETMQELFDMMLSEEISFATAFEVVKLFYVNYEKSSPREVVEHLGWFQINDMEQIGEMCDSLISSQGVAKRYQKRGSRKHLMRMLELLCERTNHKISVRRAIECLNTKLRPHDPKSSIGI